MKRLQQKLEQNSINCRFKIFNQIDTDGGNMIFFLAEDKG